jgi:hypothetical protein
MMTWMLNMTPKTPERDENATERQPLSIDVGVKFSPFLVTLSHIKLDQLGIVSRFILLALNQDGILWSQLETVLGLERRILKPIEERLIGLGYLNAEGQLTDKGRSMAELVKLMEDPQCLWVDVCNNQTSNKRRLIVLDKTRHQYEIENTEKMLLLGQEKNQGKLHGKREKKQCDDIEVAIGAWRRQEIFADILKRIWPEGKELFDNNQIINDLDIDFIAAETDKNIEDEMVIRLSVDLIMDPVGKGWCFYEPVMVCQRNVVFGDSVPDLVDKSASITERRCFGLLTQSLLGKNDELVDAIEQDAHVLDGYSENHEKSALEKMRNEFEGLSSPVFGDVRYSFERKYSLLTLGYDEFYTNAVELLDALPTPEPYKRNEE